MQILERKKVCDRVIFLSKKFGSFKNYYYICIRNQGKRLHNGFIH